MSSTQKSLQSTIYICILLHDADICLSKWDLFMFAFCDIKGSLHPCRMRENIKPLRIFQKLILRSLIRRNLVFSYSFSFLPYRSFQSRQEAERSVYREFPYSPTDVAVFFLQCRPIRMQPASGFLQSLFVFADRSGGLQNVK